MSYTLAVSTTDQNNFQNGQYGSSGGGSISPQAGQSHNHHIVRAQLPNQQRTTVSIPTGMTIKEALSKALKLRKLEPDMCSVYRLNPQCPNLKQRIEWDVDVAMLKGDEIIVETKDRVPMHTQLSHNFAKSYFTLSKCVFCQEFLMTGIRCLTCGIEFHKNCSDAVPQLCQPYIMSSQDTNYYRHLLARSNGFSPNSTIANISESSNNNSRPIRPRARSADENSKHKSKSISQQPEQQLSPGTQQRELLEEKWEIDGNDVTRVRRIGQGSFATVYEGIWHGRVALKELNVKNPSPAQLQGFKNEVLVLKRTRHPNILLFLGYVLKPNLLIVTQLCRGCSLYKHLHVKEVSFTNRQIMTLANGVAQGMEYLHAKNILHRDLKSNNIFIQDEHNLDQVKIGDFGLATFKTRYLGDQQIYHPTGSILWMAPEVIKTKPGHNPFTYQSDVYSYGIVLYELMSRKLPYFDFKYKEALIFLIGLGDPEKSPKLNLDVIGSDKPEDLKTLMLNCIVREPAERPLFKTIIKHLKKIKLLRSTSEPLRLNDLDGSSASEPMNY